MIQTDRPQDSMTIGDYIFCLGGICIATLFIAAFIYL